jgi:parvulin-like peptidyl-prolyl isomerase
MNVTAISAIRINHRTISLMQLLHRLRVDVTLAEIGRCTDDLAIECWAETLELEADTAELQTALIQWRRKTNLLTVKQTNEWLEHRGMSLDDILAILKPQVLRAALAQQAVTDEEIEKHFLDYARQYDRAEISMIITGEFGAAQELLFRVEEGSDFHALAREYSEDEATAKCGGYAGLFTRAELEPETAAAVFHAAKGDLLGPFERRHGCSLILVEELYPAKLDERVSAAIRELLFQGKLEAYRSTLDIHVEI